MVPTSWRSAEPGSAVSGSRWSRTPIGAWARTACCTAAIERGRPTASGITTVGNSTVFRTGTITMASAGSLGASLPAPVAVEDSPDGADVRPGPSRKFGPMSVIAGLSSVDPAQRKRKAAMLQLIGCELVPAAGQRELALEAAVRDLQAVDHRGLRGAGQGPLAGDSKDAALVSDLEPFGVNARQCDLDQQAARNLEDIDGRLPRGLASGRDRLEEALMQALGALQHPLRFGPHPDGGITGWHALGVPIVGCSAYMASGLRSFQGRAQSGVLPKWYRRLPSSMPRPSGWCCGGTSGWRRACSWWPSPSPSGRRCSPTRPLRSG